MPCRVNKKAEWKGRILLEDQFSDKPSSFLTLTLNDDHYPADGSLDKEIPRAFLNRLRYYSKESEKNRYFTVGEYGEQSTKRAHFHMALFGHPPDEYEKIFKKCWKVDGEELGHIKTGELTPGSANYIAGYCTKKMTSKGDIRLDGRQPEFATMSQRPCIGFAGFKNMVEIYKTRTGSAALDKLKDISPLYRIQGCSYVIPPYWQKWMREQLGIVNPPDRQEGRYDDPFLFELEQIDAIRRHNKLFHQAKRNDSGLKGVRTL